MTAETLTRKPETTNTAEDSELVNTIVTQLTSEEADRIIIDYAFGRLYNKYSNGIAFRYRTMINDEESLKDLVAGTFKKAYEKICFYESTKSAFSTWLFTISRNLYIDYMRSNKASTTTLISQMGTSSEDGQSIPYEARDLFAKTGQEICEKKQKAALINKVIDNCFAKKPFLKELIIKRFYEEKSYQEIAESTGKPLGTIKATLMRAKDKLKLALENEGINYF